MREIGGVGDVDRVDAAGLLLCNALVDPLGAGALDPEGDSRIFGLKGLAEPFSDVKFERRIIRNLAFAPRRFDQMGVTLVDGGAAARAGCANIVPAARAVEVLSTSRLDHFRRCIGVFSRFFFSPFRYCDGTPAGECSRCIRAMS